MSNNNIPNDKDKDKDKIINPDKNVLNTNTGGLSEKEYSKFRYVQIKNKHNKKKNKKNKNKKYFQDQIDEDYEDYQNNNTEYFITSSNSNNNLNSPNHNQNSNQNLSPIKLIKVTSLTNVIKSPSNNVIKKNNSFTSNDKVKEYKDNIRKISNSNFNQFRNKQRKNY